MPSDVFIRRASPEDIDEITGIFRSTVLHVNRKDYNEEQVKIWAQSADKSEKFLARMNEQYFIVAEMENSICGFASFASDGYLDLMYVHKDCQGRGIANLLIKELERYAAEQKIHHIYSDASITAKPFFEKMGFVVVKKNSKMLGGTAFINYTMNKSLLTA
ncbi:MAG: GNAT family N-acetyltransferase [Chitinophagaceae bacterium]|nr:GNAT family N-acetyltransferase [Chitinophagaceae bacterium]